MTDSTDNAMSQTSRERVEKWFNEMLPPYADMLPVPSAPSDAHEYVPGLNPKHYGTK